MPHFKTRRNKLGNQKGCIPGIAAMQRGNHLWYIIYHIFPWEVTYWEVTYFTAQNAQLKDLSHA